MRTAHPRAHAASFARAAGTYLAHAGVQEALARWLAEWLPEDRSGRALEIGAGPGVFTKLLLPWPGTLTASDLSPEMCAVGRDRLPKVAWRAMAAEEPAGGPWAWILSSSMLQWAADPVSVFRAWRERLAPGGRVLAALFAAGSLPEWEALAVGAAPLAWRTPGQWRSFLAEAGFRILRDGTERHVAFHPSARAFLRSLHGVGAAPERRMPPARLRSLLSAYEARNRSEDGVSATWTFYRFEAVSADDRSSLPGPVL